MYQSKFHVLKTMEFWDAALSRVVRTFCQTMIAMMTSGAVGIFESDWKQILSVSVMAGVVSLFTSIMMGIPESKPGYILEREAQQESNK